MLNKISAIAAAALAFGAIAATPTQATQFANYFPVAGGATNISLTGLNLSAAAPVQFQYTFPGALASLGVLSANLSLSALETGALGFGPASLASFDGSFSITYSGPNQTIGTTSLTTGETLLDGTFLGSIFTGYGSTGTLQDSLLGGGFVNFNNNSLISFTPPGGDEGFTIGITDLTPPVSVVGGQLTNFSGVSDGNFAADNVLITSGGTPEPAAWAMMLIGVAGIGFVTRRRAKAALA